MLFAWKERGLRRLDRLLAELVVEVVPRPDGDTITYVPGDRDRTLWRGLNTAELLARELAGRWDLPLEALLQKASRVERQRGLDRRSRRTNVREAFAATSSPVERRVVLVDDVYTTGATVGAAAGALRRAGARRVDVVTLARAVRG